MELASHESAESRPVRLVASRDRRTGGCVFPRIPESSPAASRYEPVELSPQAALYSFTIIHPNPKTGQAPFVLVYADFPEAARVFGRLHLQERQRPRIGMALVTISNGAGDYVFTPAQEDRP